MTPPLFRAGAVVVVTGAAVDDLVYAVQAAHAVTARDGVAAPARWRVLLEELRAAQAASTSPSGSGELPVAVDDAPSALIDPVTSKEAAQMLGCSPRNVRDLRDRGVLTGRLVARRLLFERSGVAAVRDGRQSA